MPTLLSTVQGGDVLKIFNALTAMRKLLKRFEYKMKEERGPLDATLQVTFPVLQQLMTNILHNNSLEAAQVMRLCLKIFFSATVYMLPQVASIDVNLWFQAIAAIVDKPLPEAEEGIEPVGQPKDPDERKMWPWWKLKKWAIRIVTQFMQRYGNPRYCAEENAQFAEYFKNNTAVQFIGPVMNNLVWKAQGKFVSSEVHRQCLTYLVSCAEMSPTYKAIKPHLQFLLTDIIFPTLCLTAEDLENFENDPTEFIRRVYDPLNDWLSPTVAATNLLQMLARYRKSDTMPIILPFLQSILVEYLSAPPEQRNYLKKDGVLVALSALVKVRQFLRCLKFLMESKTCISVIIYELPPFLNNDDGYLLACAYFATMRDVLF